MKKISIIILLCLIMSIIVSCGKDNDVKDTHNTSNDNLSSLISDLQSQVSALQSQINQKVSSDSNPNNEIVDTMYYEIEIDGETYVTQGTALIPDLKISGKSVRVTVETKKGSIFFNVPMVPSDHYNQVRDWRTLKNGEEVTRIRVIFKRINSQDYYFVNMNDLRTLGLI